jgi:hypothetical protein
MPEPFNPLAVLATVAAPQQTVAEAHALEMAAVQTAMSSLFIDTAKEVDETLTPVTPTYEETSEQNQDSQPHDQRANPQAVGTSTVKRKSSTTKGR